MLSQNILHKIAYDYRNHSSYDHSGLVVVNIIRYFLLDLSQLPYEVDILYLPFSRLSPLKRGGHWGLLRRRNLSNESHLRTHGVRIVTDELEPYEAVNI